MGLKINFNDEIKYCDIIILDCDGVIFNSNKLKTDSFRYALREYPKTAVNKLVEYHQNYGGISRYKKMEKFFTEIYEVKNEEHAIKCALNEFAEYIEKVYLNEKPVKGAIDFSRLCINKCILYVVSGSDQNELRGIFKHHQIDGYYTDIFGSPEQKTNHVHNIIENHNIPVERILMIGDGRADYEAAKKYNIQFIFLSEMSEWSEWGKYIHSDNNVMIANNWQDILRNIL